MTKGQIQEALATALPLTYAFRRFDSTDRGLGWGWIRDSRGSRSSALWLRKRIYFGNCMNEQALKIFLRKPLLPAIVISKNELLPCTNMGMLAAGLMKAEPEGLHVHVVDSVGGEFWYIPEQQTLAPGFTFRKWTKIRLIDSVNRSSNAKRLGVQCSTKGLSNKRFTEIMDLMIAFLVAPAGRENGERR